MKRKPGFKLNLYEIIIIVMFCIIVAQAAAYSTQQWTADVGACMKFLGVELSYCQRAADELRAAR